MENGADGIRINPGNLGGQEKIALVVAAAKRHRVPIRVGVNSGSIEKDLLQKHGYPTAANTAALIESAMRNVRLVEKHGYNEIKISIKSADVLTTVNAYQTAFSDHRLPAASRGYRGRRVDSWDASSQVWLSAFS